MSIADSWDADTDRTRRLRERMVSALAQAGDITDERWRQAFAAVPRHALVPRYYRADNYQKIEATVPTDQTTWLQAVYSDETLITQKTPRTVTSSGTMPSLIALMLNALDVHDHHQVLQVGTGTGYTAGLLCERLGSDRVTTIDIDPELVQAAHARLASVGYQPTAVTDDGAGGYPPNAPYHRVLATCGLSHIPSAWLAQAAPGARIVAPVAKGLIVLDVLDADYADGRFLAEGGYFMPLRHSIHDTDSSSATAVAATSSRSRPTALGPRDTFYHQHVRFFLTIALPEVSVAQHGPSIDDLIIQDTTGSSARLDTTPNDSFLVTEAGPRSLWTEVEQLHHLWRDCDQPRRQRFGLTVTPERQWIWLDTPHGQHTWDIPTQEIHKARR
ncbi:MAG: methyltransferase domain-containing protein [Pseudonocardiales bacterium]